MKANAKLTAKLDHGGSVERHAHRVGSECAGAAHRAEDQRRHADAGAVRRVRAGRGESRWRRERENRGRRHDRPRRNSPATSTPPSCRRISASSASSCATARCTARRARGGGFKLAGQRGVRQGTRGIRRRDGRTRRRGREDRRPEFPGGGHSGGQRDRDAGPHAHRRSEGLSTARRSARFRAPPSTCRSCRRTRRRACRPTSW